MRQYDAVAFDLLTALLDSWTLWENVAGSRAGAMAWRTAYLAHTYGTGAYRPYETLVAEAAVQVGLPASLAHDLSARWDELTPWPEVTRTLEHLSGEYRLAVVTNCSESLARRAAARVGPFSVVVSAERAGYYKPVETPYRLALSELGVPATRTLFVAGSAYDLDGAARVGMPVFWHNRVGLVRPPEIPAPLAESPSFSALEKVLSAAAAHD